MKELKWHLDNETIEKLNIHELEMFFPSDRLCMEKSSESGTA